ncbi:MAG: hypothetical protein WCX61_05065, partial [Candidatus Peribacteraceae bacterium]
LRFRAVVVMGDKKGKVGLGTGKATEVQTAVRKASADAKRHMIRIPIKAGTIPHEVDTKFKAARIRLLPAPEGTGIIAGGALRVVLEQAGVRNVFSKRYGTTNKLVNAQAVMEALGSFRCAPPPEEEKKTQKKEIKVQVATEASQDADALEQERKQEVKEISKKDAENAPVLDL